MRRPQLVLHPLLFAAYPVLFLFAANAAEQVTLEPLWVPLAMAVGGAALLLVALTALLRDPMRAGLLTTLAVALFFAYGHTWNLVGVWLGSQWLLLAVWVGLAGIGAVLAWRAGRWAARANRTLNVLAAIAVALNLASIGGYFAGSGGGPLAAIRPAAAHGVTARPDVYYIVPDRYAGTEALSNTYDYDNSPFFEELEARGFYVATDSHANYIKTPMSLVSSLSMEYLDDAQLNAEASSGEDREPIHRRLREQLPVPHALQELGYRHIQVTNWWTPTNWNVDADVIFRYHGVSEFSAALRQTTLLAALDIGAVKLDPWDWRVLRQDTLYALDRLKEIPQMAGPKFVFAHLLIPHSPYVFDRDGSFMDREQVAEQGDVESYVRQLEYANRRILGVIDRILAASPDAVIVLQADEGPFPARYQGNEWGFDWTEATDAELEQKFGILNAFRLPGVSAEEAGLYPDISPVNSFRVVFNEYFGYDLPLLPDRIYAHVDLSHFYDTFEITDRLAD